jgi:hypothetical protein
LAHHPYWLPAGAVVDAEGADVATYMHCTCPCSKPEHMNNPLHEETMMQPPIFNIKWKSFQQTVGGHHKRFMDEVQWNR